MQREAGDPDARTDLERQAVDTERFTQRCQHALGDVGRGVIVGPGHQDRELVTAQPRDGVALADSLLQPLGDAGQQLVADAVAERVVDLLEPVEVNEQHGDDVVVPTRLRNRMLDAFGEQRTVRQPCKAIVARQPFVACQLFMQVRGRGGDRAGQQRVQQTQAGTDDQPRRSAWRRIRCAVLSYGRNNSNTPAMAPSS
ncbi:hypothetical protein BH23ACT10_BH23ACT10_01790 [soil metagenome]